MDDLPEGTRKMLLLTLLALFLGFVEVRAESVELAETRNKRSAPCFGTLGCFPIGPSFVSINWPLTFYPQSPDVIQTQYLLFTRESSITPQKLDARNLNLIQAAWTNFKARQTKIIIHGFLEKLDLKISWQDCISELLKHDNYNVIFVDWSKGNQFPYTQASANTRVVGAQVSELVTALAKLFTISLLDFHIIGHSLGSHTAGYAGEKIPGLGRITGLDPAGPYFEGMDKKVRLDETDALFVDALHTDATSLLQFGFGTKTLSGHVDFFPNLGHDQPGCPPSAQKTLQNFLTFNLFDATEHTLMCSHLVAVNLFNESINSPCPFMAFLCASEADFVNNLCHSCSNGGCQRMGFHAKKIEPWPGHMKYYTTTGDRYPYCGYHFIVTVKLSPGHGTQQQGALQLAINGAVFTFRNVPLTRNVQIFQPGQIYMFAVMLSQDPGNVQAVALSWISIPPSNGSNQSNKSLVVDEIDIYREETGIDAQFCAGGQELVSGGSLVVSKKC